MPEGPEVAVVIGAYRRRRYLLGAVRSVLSQTLPRERFEVVVTKSFADPEIDGFLAEHRIPSQVDENPRIGPWLISAVAATKAPFIALLDDDDEFVPERLAHALDVLHAHPSIGFYRNRVDVIDAEGAPSPRTTWRPNELDRFFDEHGPVLVPPGAKSELAALGLERTRVTFNASTMVVRRDLFEGEFGKVFARTQLQDVSLFVLAALSPFGLYLDDQRLTKYRRYPGNVTRQTSWLAEARNVYADLSSVAQRYGASDLASRLARFSRRYDRVYRSSSLVDRIGAGASRREVAHRAADYLRFLGQNPAERSKRVEVWSAGAYAAAYLVAPGIVRRVSLRQAARRRP